MPWGCGEIPAFIYASLIKNNLLRCRRGVVAARELRRLGRADTIVFAPGKDHGGGCRDAMLVGMIMRLRRCRHGMQQAGL